LSAQAQTLSEQLPGLLKKHERIVAAKQDLVASERGLQEAYGDWLPTADVTFNLGSESQKKPGTDQDKNHSAEKKDSGEQQHDEEHVNNNQKGKEDPNEGSKKDQNKNPADVDKNENKSSDSPEQQKIASNSNPDLSPEDRSKQQKLEQWLRKIPDDPGRLLRNKMKREYQRRDKKHIESKQYW